MQQDNWWANDAPVQPSQGASPIPGYRMVAPAAPDYQYKGPQAAADLEKSQIATQTDRATLPYAGPKAAADAEKARIDAEAARVALEKSRRDLAAQQSTANPEQQKGMAALANDEVLAAIARARKGISEGHSAGRWAKIQNVPLIGGLAEPQGVVDLRGDLGTVSSRVTIDTLAKLKAMSATGAYGFGALSEREGALLRDSVAALDQEQSPAKLLENLANVERHYRRVSALTDGKDYRDPKVVEAYGIARAPGGQGDQPNALATGGFREEADPALKGVNGQIRKMIGEGRDPAAIVGFMNSVSPGLGDEKAGDVMAAVKFRAQNPTVPLDRYSVSVETRQVPMGTARSMTNAAAQTPGGAYAMNAIDALSAGNAAKLTDNPTLARAGMDAVSSENPVSSFLGTATGGAITAAGLEGALPFRAAGAIGQAMRQPVADALYGGVYSKSTGGSFLGGAAEGVVGGAVGRGATRAAGATLRGVVNPDAQYLRGQGVRMTPGAALGNEGRFAQWYKGREDRLSGFSGIGDRIKGQQRNSFIDVNRAAFADAVPPTAQTAVDNYAEQGIEQLRQATREGYDAALSGRNFDLTEPQLQNDVTGMVRNGLNIPRTGPEFGYHVRERIDPVMSAGTADGPQMQDVLQGLRDADFGTDAMGTAANNAAGNVRGAFTDMIDRQAPDVMPNLTAADRSYRHLNILADAVGKAKNTDGIFTPAQLGQAATTNAKRFNGPIAAATTQRPYFDLQRAAQNLLPSKVPDSGTAGRTEAGRGLFGAIRGGVRNAINAPLYSDTLQPALNTALLDRTPAMRVAGQQVMNNARLGGLFGAPMLVAYGP